MLVLIWTLKAVHSMLIVYSKALKIGKISVVIENYFSLECENESKTNHKFMYYSACTAS